MGSILNWEWDTYANEQRAEYRGLVIRVLRDDYAENPFEEWDTNWAIAVRAPDSFSGITTYRTGKRHDRAERDNTIPLSDVQLVHDQIAVARILGFESIREIMVVYVTEEPVNYCRDAAVLRDCFEQALDDTAMSSKLETVRQLHALAGVPAYRTTVRGYSQGDWAEVLVVATPEDQERFGVTEVSENDMERTARLYGDWAFGDVYGYKIAREVDGELVDLDYVDSSCWGFYGTDHAESGLEAEAIAAADHILVMEQERRDDIALALMEKCYG